MDCICNSEKCTGCGACQNICKMNAIKMDYNSEGFISPVIYSEKCIECRQCKKICPAIQSNIFFKPIIAYKGSSNNIDIKKDSTSGGIFSELAKEIIMNGGSVIGAYINDDFNVNHILINKLEDLWKLRGSKYIGSNTTNIFRIVQEKLNNGETVLFSGTPCQIAGLKNFIHGNNGRLITCDFICHGVASKTIFDMFLANESQKTNNLKIERFLFRFKGNKYTNFSCLFLFSDKSSHRYNFYKTSFGNAFSSGMINRLSCSTCSFAKTERVSDITLADCIHDLNKKEKKYGCSYVLVNTELGKQLLSKCDVNVTPIDIVLIRKFQSHLNEPQHFHKYRPCIMNNINRGFSFLLTNYMSPPKRNIVRSIKSRTKSIKERIKHV